MLVDILQKREHYMANDGERYFDAAQNARLVASAERYYRTMYYGSRASWNLRDSHMYDTLQNLLAFHGSDAKAVVWAHNSHIGNALATEMSARGEHNIGQLCREHFGRNVYAIGFGTHDGTVAAASNWDAPMEIKNVRPSHPNSYEYLCHSAKRAVPAAAAQCRRAPDRRAEQAAARTRDRRDLPARQRTREPLLSGELPQQFDEYIWFDRTQAVTPFETQMLKGLPDTYPFGLYTCRRLADIDYVLAKLRWMETSRIWPNGLRYLWTDAFGVVLLVSLYRHLNEPKYLAQAEAVVSDVERVLGRPRGIRIGEAADRDGQYFHYLSMWLYALGGARPIQARVHRARYRAGTADPRRVRDSGTRRRVEDA